MGGWPRLADGLGDIDRARMERLLQLSADSRRLPRQPAVDEVFTSAFLPFLDERRIGPGPTSTAPGDAIEEDASCGEGRIALAGSQSFTHSDKYGREP